MKKIVERFSRKNRRKISIKHENGTKYTEELKITNHEETLKVMVIIDPQYGCFKSLSEIDAIGHKYFIVVKNMFHQC